MQNLRMIIRVLFISTFIFLFGEGLYIHFVHHMNLNIIGLETANTIRGTELLAYFYGHSISGRNLIYYAQLNTYVDFLFIIGYAGMMIIITNNLLRRVKHQYLCMALRTCLLMTIAAGILDIFENSILLSDMHGYYPGKAYVSSMYVSYSKWILAGTVFVIWIVAFIHTWRIKSVRTA